MVERDGGRVDAAPVEAGPPPAAGISRRGVLSAATRLGAGAVGLGLGLAGGWPRAAAARAESPYAPNAGAALERVDPLWAWRAGCGADQWPHVAVDDTTLLAGWGDGWGWRRSSSEAKSFMGFTRIAGTAAAPKATDVWADRLDRTMAAQSLKPQVLLRVGGEILVYAVSKTDDRNATRLYRMPLNGSDLDRVSDSVVKRSVEGLQVVGTVHHVTAGTGERVLLLAEHGGLESRYLYEDPGNPKNPRVWAARVPSGAFARASAWEWFCGVDEGGQPVWSAATVRGATFTAAGDRPVVPVFADPAGAGKHVMISWCPSLNGYVLAKTQNWLELGLFVSDTPYGPWTTLFYGPFVPAGASPQARIFTAQVVTMWSEGGEVAVMWSGAPQPTPCSDPDSGNYDAVHLTRFTVRPGSGGGQLEATADAGGGRTAAASRPRARPATGN